ncbi:MAG: hypoxanthine phosphoribosyltransferase [Clostridia bacterium]|nr:hypoxanthine phosphoribosyltransferase [Clostridia bacterium]
MNTAVKRILISKRKLKNINKRLGRQITKDYKDKNLLIVCILKSSAVFVSDLLRNIKCDCKVDYISVSSYNGTKPTGNIEFKKDIDINPEGYDILLIDDIIDTGNTLKYVKEILLEKNPFSIRICCLLDKPYGRKADINADYIGKIIPDEYVIGYGLDYDEKYRNLPFIGILSDEQERR